MRSDDESITTSCWPSASKSLAEQLPGPAEAGDQEERLAQPPDLAGEALQRDRLLERPVLQQGQQRADRVRPADHRRVDRERSPTAAAPAVNGHGSSPKPIVVAV